MNRAHAVVCGWAIAAGIAGATACGDVSPNLASGENDDSTEDGAADTSLTSDAGPPDAREATQEAQTAEAGPIEAQPTEAQPTDAQLAEAQPIDATAIDAPSPEKDATLDSASPPDGSSGPGADAQPSNDEDVLTDATSDGADEASAADATDEADGGSLTETEQALATGGGATCLACARSHGCLDAGSACEDLTQVADAGPAIGSPPELLCVNLLACELRTSCYLQGGSEYCVCALLSVQTCEASGAAAGAATNCTAEEQAALESTDPNVEIVREHDPSYPGGVADNLAICLLASDCTTCF